MSAADEVVERAEQYGNEIRDQLAPSPDWEAGYREAWNAIARHHEGREEQELADLLSNWLTTDDGIGQRYVRADDDMFVDAARQVLEAGWFRTECCRFCAPSAREHETDEGHTRGESCCQYCPPRSARRVGSFAAPGGPRRLADKEGGS